MPSALDVSIVVPVYRSEECVEELAYRLRDVLSAANMSFQIIMVNDCSPDGSWEKIVDVSRSVPQVVGVNLRKNAGQDNAIMAGLAQASGNAVVIMDDDLQHNPDDVVTLVQKVDEGYDVCYARFETKRQAVWKNLGSWLNDKMANIVIGKSAGIYMSPFKAISGELAEEITKYDGPFPYVDGLIFRATSHITQVLVTHHDRFAGRSNYNLVRSIGVWLKVATGFSLAPLRIATYLGFSFSAVGLLLGLIFAIRRLVSDVAPTGWVSTIVAVLVLGGIQLGSMGIVGEYLGRVFLHLNRRPQFVLKEIVGYDGTDRSNP